MSSVPYFTRCASTKGTEEAYPVVRKGRGTRGPGQLGNWARAGLGLSAASTAGDRDLFFCI